MIPDDLGAALRSLADRPTVLVGLDFDGVLAPLVDHRDQARALPGSLEAARSLAALTGVEVALVSGRALDSLRQAGELADDEAALSLIGSHGAETRLRPGLHDDDHAVSANVAALAPAGQALLDRVVSALDDIAAAGAGLEVETKPAGAVLHYRLARPEVAEPAAQAAVSGPGSWPGVHVTLGKSVVELAVTETSKGIALQQLRDRLRPEAVLYVGDDATDETAFAVLGPTSSTPGASAADVSVKVGPGLTQAAYRIVGPEDVRELLQLLLAERSQR